MIAFLAVEMYLTDEEDVWQRSASINPELKDFTGSSQIKTGLQQHQQLISSTFISQRGRQQTLFTITAFTTETERFQKVPAFTLKANRFCFL